MAEQQNFNKVSFYIVAHADDWQLFMQPNAYYDLVSNNNKVVFIVTTAGDAGLDKAYWSAREEGMKSSIRFCLAPLGTIIEATGTKQFHEHNISYWSANDALCYFLRLPDGNLDGNGFDQYNHQSLVKLNQGQITSITTVDNSTNYISWHDFHSTLQSIIETEAGAILDRHLNYLNPDAHLNPNDHIDHITTGEALQKIRTRLDLQHSLFVGYSVNNNTSKLEETDSFWKAGMFAAYEKAVFDLSGYSTLQETIPTYLKWCMSSATFITTKPSISD